MEERETILEDYQRLLVICEDKTRDNEKKAIVIGKLQFRILILCAEIERLTK